MIRSFFVLLTFFCFFSIQALSENFKFGLSIPLSGPLAEYGIAAKNGFELAKKDYPELFKKIDIIYLDNKWDNKTAVTVLKQFQSIHKIDLLYSWGNPTSEAIASIVKREKLPTIAMSSDPVINKDNKYIIRSINAVEHLSIKLAEYLNSKNYKNIAMVMFENSYVRGLYKGLEKHLAKDAKISLLGTFEASERDFKPVLIRLKKGEYDCIGALLVSGQVSSFYKQMRGFNLQEIPTFGADFLDSKQEIKSANGAMEGAVFPNFLLTDSFYKRYKSEYGNDVQIAFAGNAYDIAKFVGETFESENVKELNSEKILELLKKEKKLSGASDSFELVQSDNEGAYLDFPIGIMRVEKLETVKVDF